MLSHQHIVFHDPVPASSQRLVRTASHLGRDPQPWVRPPGRRVEEVSQAAADFCAWVLKEAALDAHTYRTKPLGRRVAACLRAMRCQSVDEARAAIERDRKWLDVAVDSLLIGVTWFYRDPTIVEPLCGYVRRKAVGRRRPWRIWSVGCSDGAELYTMGMALAEAGSLAGSVLRGTDCRRSAIQRAQAGEFGDDRIASLPPDWVQRYLQPHRGGRSVVASLRHATQWDMADITAYDTPSDPWDVILCRNLAIYLMPQAADRLWERLASSLAVGGLLVLGKAERPQRDLPLKRLGLGLYLKLGADEEKA